MNRRWHRCRARYNIVFEMIAIYYKTPRSLKRLLYTLNVLLYTIIILMYS